ncbi:MAG: 50S ribosomal protein L4 [Nitrosopumilaceae archaeon]|nr:50S ribosomal protein L4 [Nitrosopumilaceae archaeon]
MKATAYSTNGAKEGEVELPIVFSTPVRKDLIHKAYTNLNSHKFQPQGRHPTAGMDVVARSNDPPTGRGVSRIAKMRGGGGGREGQAGGVASVRGGRQAHPPIVDRVIHKKLNKKENKLALCSAIAATTSKKLVEERGHKVDKIESFPIIISDEIESISKASEMSKVLQSLKLVDDVKRLEVRKPRTGKSSLRGRNKKIGKSVLFVTKDDKKISKACGSFPGVEVRSVRDLSVLDLAPGSDLIRLTVYSKSAIEEIGKIKSPHLELMVKMK